MVSFKLPVALALLGLAGDSLGVPTPTRNDARSLGRSSSDDLPGGIMSILPVPEAKEKRQLSPPFNPDAPLPPIYTPYVKQKKRQVSPPFNAYVPIPPPINTPIDELPQRKRGLADLTPEEAERLRAQASMAGGPVLDIPDVPERKRDFLDMTPEELEQWKAQTSMIGGPSPAIYDITERKRGPQSLQETIDNLTPEEIEQLKAQASAAGGPFPDIPGVPERKRSPQTLQEIIDNLTPEEAERLRAQASAAGGPIYTPE